MTDGTRMGELLLLLDESIEKAKLEINFLHSLLTNLY